MYGLMSTPMNRQILLNSYPMGQPKPDNFALVEGPVPKPGEGGVLCRTIYLSIDPATRVRMAAPATALGAVIPARTVSQVIESRNPAFASGDFVAGSSGWQLYDVSAASDLRKLDPREAPISSALGLLGSSGMTAYVALLDLGRPQPGETVVVSAASGSVGMVAGQIAKIKGCRAVGIAGSDDKCRFVTKELGFDFCLNYKTQDIGKSLRESCPDGVDIYFDNVGGAILEAVLQHINLRARILLVGRISEYNAITPPPGPNLLPLSVKCASMHGLNLTHHWDRMPEFLAVMGGWAKEGRIKYKEDVVDGLENAPEALIGLFSGSNFGKKLVRVTADPTVEK